MSGCGNACCGYGVRGPQGDPGPAGPPGPPGEGMALFSGEIIAPEQSWPSQGDTIALTDVDLGDLIVQGDAILPAEGTGWLLSGQLTFATDEGPYAMTAEVWLEDSDGQTVLSQVFSTSGTIDSENSVSLFFLAFVAGTSPSGVRLAANSTGEPLDVTTSLSGLITAIHMTSQGS